MFPIARAVLRHSFFVALAAALVLAGCSDDDNGGGTVEPEVGGIDDWTGIWSRTITTSACDIGRAATFADTFLVCPDGVPGEVFDVEGDGSGGRFWICDDFTWTGTTGRLVCDVLVTDVAFLGCTFQYDIDVQIVRDGDDFTWTARVDWAPVDGCEDDLVAGCVQQTGTGRRLSRDVSGCVDAPIDISFDLETTDDIGISTFSPAFAAGDRILDRVFVETSALAAGRERILNLSVPVRESAGTMPLIALPDTLVADLPETQAVLFYLDLRGATALESAWLLSDFTGTITYEQVDGRFDATVQGNGTLLDQLSADDPVPTAPFTLDGELRMPVRVLAVPPGEAPVRRRAEQIVDRVLRHALAVAPQ